MIKIIRVKKGHKLIIVDKTKQRIEYLMTDKEYKALVLKGWEDYVHKYCGYAKKFCKYSKKVRPYIDKFCGFVEKICGEYEFTLREKK